MPSMTEEEMRQAWAYTRRKECQRRAIGAWTVGCGILGGSLVQYVGWVALPFSAAAIFLGSAVVFLVKE